MCFWRNARKYCYLFIFAAPKTNQKWLRCTRQLLRTILSRNSMPFSRFQRESTSVTSFIIAGAQHPPDNVPWLKNVKHYYINSITLWNTKMLLRWNLLKVFFMLFYRIHKNRLKSAKFLPRRQAGFPRLQKFLTRFSNYTDVKDSI